MMANKPHLFIQFRTEIVEAMFENSNRS